MKHFRNRFFIRDPGRYLGGVFAFTKGFRDDAWIATIILMISLPAAMHMIYYILKYSKMIEDKDWNYFWNIFVFFGTFTQQVVSKSFKVFKQCPKTLKSNFKDFLETLQRLFKYSTVFYKTL